MFYSVYYFPFKKFFPKCDLNKVIFLKELRQYGSVVDWVADVTFVNLVYPVRICCLSLTSCPRLLSVLQLDGWQKAYLTFLNLYPMCNVFLSSLHKKYFSPEKVEKVAISCGDLQQSGHIKGLLKNGCFVSCNPADPTLKQHNSYIIQCNWQTGTCAQSKVLCGRKEFETSCQSCSLSFHWCYADAELYTYMRAIFTECLKL